MTIRPNWSHSSPTNWRRPRTALKVVIIPSYVVGYLWHKLDHVHFELISVDFVAAVNDKIAQQLKSAVGQLQKKKDLVENMSKPVLIKFVSGELRGVVENVDTNDSSSSLMKRVTADASIGETINF